MYAVFFKMETKGHFIGRERKFDTSSVASAWDRLHLAKLGGQDAAPKGAIGVILMNTDTGRVLRTHLFPVAQIDLSGIKLTDAMTKALFADEAPLVGLPGASNTLRALESRGLVKRDNVGVARLTSLGRQYRAQKKG